MILSRDGAKNTLFMQLDPSEAEVPRPLTDEERNLARWMLEHGGPTAQTFLGQLDRSTATNWRCGCGCASYNLLVAGLPPAPPGVEVLSDFVFGADDDLKGIFIYEKGGILSGVELVGYGGDAPATLPSISELRPARNPAAA
jgi:hypothetical protein